LASDVEEGLTRMKQDRFPARFVLTNGANLENEREQILSYSWQERLAFLHIPKVEILAADFSIRAVSLSAAPEVVKTSGAGLPNNAPSSASDQFGSEESSRESFGFHLEADEDSVKHEPLPVSAEPVSAEETQSSLQLTPQVSSPDKPKSKFKIPSFSLPRLNLKFPKLSTASSLKLYLLTSFVLVIPIIILVSVYFFLSRAEIIIMLNPQSISESVSIVFANSPQDGIITAPAQFEQIEISQEKEIPTSGELTIGDKASGKITVYNKTNSSLTLSVDTKLESDTGLTFVLDTSVTIASSSAEIAPPFTITPGNNSGNITAAKFGAQYNLNKSEQLSVGNYSRSDLIAVVDQDLTGGSSRTVKAVSQKDVDELETDLKKAIMEEISSKADSPDSDLVTTLVSDPDFSDKNFSSLVGEEAGSISLKLTARVSTMSYSHSRLVDIVSKTVISNTHPGMRLLPDQTKITSKTSLDSESDSEEDIIPATVEVEGVIIADIDPLSYRSQLAAKPVNRVVEIVKDLPNYTNTVITVSPNIPFLNSFLPPKSDHINIFFETK